MSLNLRCLFNCFECVPVHGYICLKPKLQTPLILAKDRNRSLILTLIRLTRIPIYEPIWHAEVLCLSGVSNIIGHEEQLICAQVQMANILGFLELSHFKPIHRLFLRLILKTMQAELLPSFTVQTCGHLFWVHLPHTGRRLA